MNIGIDVVSLNKFRHTRKSHYRYWNRIFTVREWEYAFKNSHSAEHLAGMFAAKEATMKALRRVGVGEFKKIEVLHTKFGEPRVNKKGCKVSISHDTSIAFSVVLVV